ncbi:GAF domain-containing protein [Arthrobacter pigmenti]|uniref:GAF domain-containing protein n=1 Tax=Arthrobacter pigmenti TaxID=271432 RepID=A0A846RWI8_9MICC|nr:GAF and ANTAR domain-containing protein [Arthrobacter pigmenti]NJC22601.1 GAF domain-containing protein [Arthrobacter pigmenti]
MAHQESQELLPEGRLVDAVLDSKDVHDFLSELALFSVEQLDEDGELLCGVTLLRHNRAATVASSNERGRAVDEIQYSYDDGPCLRASREQEIMYAPDLIHELRWPDYAAEIVRQGMRSILAVPFDLIGDAKAALNLYSESPDRFSEEAIRTAKAHALRTSRALSLAVKVAGDREINHDLKAALESRTVIDVAVGILMGQNRCTQQDAFKLLQDASSHRNIKLREVASAVVASASGSADVKTHFDS